MRSVVPALFFFVVLHASIGLMLVRGLPAWWAKRPVRVAFLALAGVAGVGVSVWGVGNLLGAPTVVRFGMNLFQGELTLCVPLFLTLPVSIALSRGLAFVLLPRGVDDGENVASPAHPTPKDDHAAARADTAPSAAAPPSPSAPPTPMLGRRRFIHLTSSAVPTLAVTAGAGGLLMAHEAQQLPIVPMRYAGLPQGLDGLRILHLSDLHLGYFMHVAELRACLARAAALSPDLVVFTGDIADDLEELLPAMQAVAEYKPRYGVYASLGNHEHFRGIGRVRRIFDKSPVQLLVEEGRSIAIGDARLHVSAIDDPVSLRGDSRAFMKDSVARTLNGAPSDAFHLLLSHRPEGFDAAAANGVDLTLSGHTHGVQVGWNRRSLLESQYPERYLWGDYQKGKSRLYTSSGFGHWFPFRLNCPTEAPLIVLERA